MTVRGRGAESERGRRPLGSGRRRLPGLRAALLVLLAAVAYAGFLGARLPAAVAWQWAQPHLALPAEVQVGAVDGTIWEGRVVQLATPVLVVDQVRWRVRPAALWRGRLAIELDASAAGGRASAKIELVADGLRVTAGNGRLPAAPWSGVAQQLAGEQAALEGSFHFALDALALGWDGTVQSVDGRFAWHDAAVTAAERVEFGGITSTLGAEDGAVIGRLGDLGGPLRLAGTWRLEPSGDYQLDAVVDTREGAAALLTRSVEQIGPRQRDGVHLGVEGRL